LVFNAARGIKDIYELIYICKDGSRFPAVVLVTALRDEDNAIIGYLLIGTDNTVRQQVEVNRHLLSIINEVLDLSRIEAGRLQLESTDFHLASIFDKVAFILNRAVHDKGLTLAIDTDDVPLWVRVDPLRLRQALLSYAGNAPKFTEKGSITLRVRLLEEAGNGLRVRFEVVDAGVGISAENFQNFFRAFEQLDASTTRQYEGSGLGLFITQRLAHLMGGEVGVDSPPGMGSTFGFTASLKRRHFALTRQFRCKAPRWHFRWRRWPKCCCT
jgi:two-component system sensor histidine kinase/response regulator